MKSLTKSYVYECASNFSEAINSSLSNTQKTISGITFYQVGKDTINEIFLGFKGHIFYYGKKNLDSDKFSYREIKDKPSYLGYYK